VEDQFFVRTYLYTVVEKVDKPPCWKRDSVGVNGPNPKTAH
jgi:hypothetical protein